MRRGDDVAPRRGRISFKCDFDKYVVLTNFERRGWQRAHDDDEDDWNLFWASVHSVRSIFNPESGRRLGEHQLVNHFPNHHELTRKDLMVKNIKRYKKECEKQELFQDGGCGPGGGGGAVSRDSAAMAFAGSDLPPTPSEWVPTTFALPNDYPLFVEEFRKNPNESWIAKPTGKAQGRGIFLVSKLQQLKKWSNVPKTPGQLQFREPYIISRYISDPFLVGGKKFDLRIYVLVPSYRPLKIYFYKGGFCRFCVEQYSTDVAEFDNVYIHLTNVAIQRNAEDYNERHGGKWDIEDLMLFIESTMGKPASDKLQNDIEAVIIHSLKAVQGVMINDRHCFEMYGFDILIDSTLKPWLVEVNASPSLTASTEEDRLLKLRLINDTLNVVIPPNFGDLNSTSRVNAGWCEDEVVGGYVCIYDESRAQRQRADEQMQRGNSFGNTRGSGVGASERVGDGRRPARTATRSAGWR